MNLPAQTFTDPFCLEDFSERDRTEQCKALIRMANGIAEKLNEALGPAKVGIRYVNILDMDPESRFYNPDGMLGRFQIILRP